MSPLLLRLTAAGWGVLAIAAAASSVTSSTFTHTPVVCRCGMYERGAYSPAFAPRTGLIAFISGHISPPHYFPWTGVYVQQGDESRLVHGSLHESAQHPTWSPDESRLAFVNPGRGIMVVDLIGPGFAVTTLHAEWGLGESEWSPAGDRIAYSRDGEIWFISTAGGTPVQVTTSGGISPTWSPDGSQIAYVRDFPIGYSGDGSIWIHPLGGQPRPLIEGRLPAWSPNGRWIAFASERAGSRDIWVIAPSGGTPVRVTSEAGWEDDPTWSPDSRAIAYQYADGSCGCIGIVTDLPDFIVGVESTSWSTAKRLYR